MTATCGLDDCRSSCHAGAAGGRYCAPARCYCQGCPGASPAPVRGRPRTPDQVEADRQAAVDETRRQLVAARQAGDLRSALAGEPLARPGIAGGRWRDLTAGAGGLVAA